MSTQPELAAAPDSRRRVARTPFTRRFVFGAAVDSFGTGLSAATAILYFVTFIGFSAKSVAAAMSAGAVLGLVSPMPVGRAADRFGLIRVYCAILLLRGAGFVVYAWVTNYPSFLALTLLLMAFETTTPPLQQALVGRIFLPDSRVRVMTVVMAARNAALGAGTLVAGLALTTKSRPLVASLLIINGVSFFILAVVVFSLRRSAAGTERPAARRDDKSAPPDAPTARPVLRNLPFLGLSGLNGLLLLHDSVLFVLLPLWMVPKLHISAGIMTLMLALNTALSVLLQMVLGRNERVTKSDGPVLLVAVAFLIAACAACSTAAYLPKAGAIAVIAGAVVLLTIGENLHAIAGWQVSFRLSPAARRGEYLSAFNMGYGLQRVVGPLLMTGVVLVFGWLGWLVLCVIFAGAWAGFQAIAGVQSKGVGE